MPAAKKESATAAEKESATAAEKEPATAAEKEPATAAEPTTSNLIPRSNVPFKYGSLTIGRRCYENLKDVPHDTASEVFIDQEMLTRLTVKPTSVNFAASVKDAKQPKQG